MANGSRLTGVANGLGPRKISRNARCHHMHKRRGRPERSPSSGRQQARRRTGRLAHGCEPSARTREDPSADRDRVPVCEPHDSTGEPGAGNRHAGFGERGEETCPRESACGPVAKAPDKPPAPYRQRASSRLCRVGGGAPRGRWPPSAAQTVRAVFPHTAFTKTSSRDEDRWKESNRQG